MNRSSLRYDKYNFILLVRPVHYGTCRAGVAASFNWILDCWPEQSTHRTAQLKERQRHRVVNFIFPPSERTQWLSGEALSFDYFLPAPFYDRFQCPQKSIPSLASGFNRASNLPLPRQLDGCQTHAAAH